MKSIVAFFVGRPVLSTMVLTALCLLGTLAIPRLPVGLMPNLRSPGITVITRYPGVSATKIEEIITIPLERVLSDIPGIEKLVSTSNEGESRVNLIFEHDSPIRIKILDATERVHLIRNSFPREVEEPAIIQYDPSERPVFILSFSSRNLDLKALRGIAEKRIKPRFERIEGVSEVFVGGGFEREIQVLSDSDTLASHGLSFGPIMSALAGGNRFVPGGRLSGHSEQFIYSDGKYKSVDEIRAVLLAEPAGLRLAQLARVEDGYRDRTTIARTNGVERVTIYVQKAGGANTLAVTEGCRRIAEELKVPNLISEISYDQGVFIRDAVRRVAGACVFGGVIAGFVLFAFMRRGLMTLVVALTIPCSVLTTFFLMFMSNLEINVMSLSGLALGAGMLIDNSIVVSESVEAKIRQGISVGDSVIGGTAGVFAEIVSATLTTVAVFIPLIFTDPATRLLYKGLTLTVAFSLLISLLFSLTVLPAFLYLSLNRNSRGKSDQWMNVSQWPSALQELYAGFLNFSGHYLQMTRLEKWYRIASRPAYRKPRGFILVPVVLFALIPLIFQGLRKEYSSPLDTGSIEATIDLPTGTHLEETQKLVLRVDALVRSHPAVDQVSAKIEKWHASLNIKLKANTFRQTEDIIEQLKSKTDAFSEAFVYYRRAGEGGSGRELNIDFYGDDLQVLRQFARSMSGEIKKSVGGIQEAVLRFRMPGRALVIKPDKTRTALLGTTNEEVGQALRQLLTGSIVTKFFNGQREIDIRVRAPVTSIDSPQRVLQLRIPVAGKSLPLAAVADFDIGKRETRIWRKNKRKTATITLKIKGRSIDRVADDVRSFFRSRKFPPETVYAFGEEFEKLKANQKQMLFAIFMAIIVIYLLLGALFESFIQPLLILIIVPLSMTGSLLVLAAFDMALNVSVYIGFIMLGGIVVNNSILVVSTINRHLDPVIESGSLVRRVLAAASLRLRPILMTTLTTVLGMAPMILDFSKGSALFRPLAVTVSVGLTFSLFISMAIVPFACYLYYRLIFDLRIRERAAVEEKL